MKKLLILSALLFAVFTSNAFADPVVWQTPDYNASDFSTGGQPTQWIVNEANVQINEYYQSGNLLHWNLWVENTAVQGAPVSGLLLTLPAGVAIGNAGGCVGSFSYSDNGTYGTGVIFAAPGSPWIWLLKSIAPSNWKTSNYRTSISLNLDFHIQ